MRENFASFDEEKKKKAIEKMKITRQVNKKRRESMRERLEYLLARASEPDSQIDNQDLICLMLIEKAKEGNLKAIEMVRDTIGEKPTEKTSQTISGKVEVSWVGSASRDSGGAVAIEHNESDTIDVSSDSVAIEIPCSSIKDDTMS